MSPLSEFNSQYHHSLSSHLNVITLLVPILTSSLSEFTSQRPHSISSLNVTTLWVPILKSSHSEFPSQRHHSFSSHLNVITLLVLISILCISFLQKTNNNSDDVLLSDSLLQTLHEVTEWCIVIRQPFTDITWGNGMMYCYQTACWRHYTRQRKETTVP